MARFAIQPGYRIDYILGTALAYFAAGQLALLMAIPPGFASPVWPAAGIALVAVLLLGYRVLPGVLIGSASLNFFSASATGASLLESGPVALSIALGAMLQAAAGVFIVRRIIGDERLHLETPRQIGAVILGGGALATLVNATIGPSVLLTTGLVPASGFFDNWLTWWVGDALGVCVVAPILLLLANPHASTKRRLTVSLPLIITLIAAITVFLNARETGRDRLQTEFAGMVEPRHEALQLHLDNSESMVAAVTGLFLASDEVTRQDFHNYIQHAFPDIYDIEALEWVPVVPGDQREAYESAARADGLPQFQFSQQSDGAFVTSDVRDSYLPILYVEPLAGHEAALGYDSNSDPTSYRYRALNEAVGTGQQLATHRIAISHIAGMETCILMVDPVFDQSRALATPNQRRSALEGYVIATIKIDDLVHHIFDDLGENYLVQVSDRNEETGPDILFGTQSQTGSTVSWVSSVTVASRSWDIVYTPTPEFIAQRADWETWASLTGGLLVTALLGALLLVITGRTEMVVRLVNQKTRTLSEITTKLGLILDNAGDGIIGLNPSGSVLFANSRADELLGLAPGQLETKREMSNFLGQAIDDPDAEHEPSGVIAALKTSSIQMVDDEMFTRQDGSKLPVEYTAAPIRNAIGKTSGVVVVFRDISDRKTAEAERTKLVERLVRSNEELERFAFVAGHDLQEPLRMIAGFTGLLQSRYRETLNEEGQNFVQKSVDAAERMQELISNLLAYARMGKSLGDPSDAVPLSDIIEEAIGNLHHAIVETRAEINIDEMPTLHGGRGHLVRLVQNLLGNAIKYQAADKKPKIHISAQDNNDEWTISIADNGIGIDAEYREKIFDPLLRLHDRATYSGTGLGLAICAKIVDTAGGRIWAEANADQGSIFRFTWPK
jgi:PAS domain S-box-containing protein